MEIVQPSGSGSSGSPLTVTDGITSVLNVTTLDFNTGATVTDGGGGNAIVDISGGPGGVTITETEVNFGTTPKTDATFTIVDAAISGTSKIMVTESGSIGTGRVASGDSLWDTISYSCIAATGSFTLYARASGSVVGYRKLYYTYS